MGREGAGKGGERGQEKEKDPVKKTLEKRQEKAARLRNKKMRHSFPTRQRDAVLSQQDNEVQSSLNNTIRCSPLSTRQ